MTRGALRLICNTLAISGSAIFAGVMLAIGVTLGGYWQSLPPDSFLDWFSQNNHFIMDSTRLAMFPALLGMASSLWLSRTDRRERNLWLAALGCVVAVLLITVAYEVPTNAQFAAKSIPLGQVSATLDTWLLVHSIRITLAAIASVLGIVAISLFSIRQRPEGENVEGKLQAC